MIRKGNVYIGSLDSYSFFYVWLVCTIKLDKKSYEQAVYGMPLYTELLETKGFDLYLKNQSPAPTDIAVSSAAIL